MDTTQRESFDHEDAIEQEVGLSSAMHDIRLLAASYREERSTDRDPIDSLDLGAMAIDPRLLVPAPPAPRSERWRTASLALLMLLGLTTSALALMLFRDPVTSVSAPAPRAQQPVFAISSELPEPEAEQERSWPSEPPLYMVSTALGSVAEEEIRESVAPPAPRRSAPSRVRRAAAPAVEEVSSCDEVACLLDSQDPCCGQFESVRKAEPEEEDVVQPYRPTRAQAMEPFQKITGRVRACFDEHDYRGVALVTIRIAPEGSVQSFELDDGSEAFQSCVREQVENLHFAPLEQPFTLSYPYTYR